MPSGISFWKRVGSALRANFNRSDGNGKTASAAIEPTGPSGGNGRDAGNGASSVASLLPWTRRQRSIEQLREGYERVLELMDAMHGHFEKQDRRAEELTAGVDRIGGTLVQLADAQRAQGECIASIAARVNDAAKYSASLSTMLLEMPASLQAQTEAIRMVAREMEATRAADAQFLQHFSQATDALHDAGTAQVETLQRLHDAGQHQKDALQLFVRSQTRLLLTITIIVAVLGLGAVGALAVVAHMVFNQ